MDDATELFTRAAQECGLTLDVTWLANPGTSGDAWKDEAFRFEFVLRLRGKVILAGPYWAGVGHATYRGAPVSLAEQRRRDVSEAVTRAVRTGKSQGHPDRVAWSHGIAPRLPTLADVLGSLAMDDPNDATFSEWCADYGYDTDSKKADAMFREIQDNTAKLRRAVGADAWRRLCELAREL